MSYIIVKQGEAKTITFTITDADGVAVDVSAATLSFAMKGDRDDASVLVSKEDGDFGKAQAVSGIVTLPLDSDDTNQTIADGLTEKEFIGELKIAFSASNTDLSDDITIKINKAIH